MNKTFIVVRLKSELGRFTEAEKEDSSWKLFLMRRKERTFEIYNETDLFWQSNFHHAYVSDSCQMQSFFLETLVEMKNSLRCWCLHL